MSAITVEGNALTELVTPLVNLNGNSANSLIAYAMACKGAVDLAIGHLHQANDLWHGRNFQTAKEPQAMQRAAQEAFRERLLILSYLSTEFEQLAIAIYDQTK